MFFIFAALALQLASSAEYKREAQSVAANGQVEPHHSYVRRESREKESLMHQEPEPVNTVVQRATEAVSTLTVKAGEDKTVGVWKDEEKEASLAMSLALLASIGFVLAVFCMVSSSNSHLKVSTWRVLVSSISLFSVVLIFMAAKKLWKVVVGTTESDEAKVVSDFFSFFRFLALLFAIPQLLKSRMDNENLKHCAQIAGVHLIGFAGADAFTDVLKQDAFNSSPYYYLCGVVGTAACLGVLTWGTTKLRRRSGESASGAEAAAPAAPAAPAEAPAAAAEAEETPLVSDAPASPWMQLVEKMEIQATGFVVGFLISMWVRFAVTGAVPGARYGRKVTGDDVPSAWMLLALAPVFLHMLTRMSCGSPHARSYLYGYAMFTAACAVGMEWAVIPHVNGREGQAVLKRAMRTVSESLWMALAWLVFYGSQWVLWHMTADESGTHHTAKLTASNGLALVGSAMVFVPMIAGQMMNSMRWMVWETFVSMAALILAFSWETAVYMAVQGSAESIEGDSEKKLVGMLNILSILAIILPGWYLYMLPLAREEPKAEGAEGEKAEATKDTKDTKDTKVPEASEAS
ncbi:unnamed protein product [Effrenium voratum]|uniref:Uncharacterized protein n=1 Tax=Effrenium voratum TaxID=2562239 RepID=A0AA36NJ50_9DINO|nr:unnamed protein product [Effrenium voratum]